MLTAEQSAAVAARGMTLCRAAPGSGKTRTLVERIVDLIQTGAHPSEVLALTFTRRAAREMRERIADRLGTTRASRLPTLSTFHSWSMRLLREFATEAGLDPLFVVRDDDDREDLILAVGAELDLKWKSARRLWQEQDVRDRYDQLMRESRAVDYDGLETGLLKLLSVPEVVTVLRARWPFVLVDEGQDTSEVQQRILDRLAPRDLFVVGDPGQSIYAFRGAHVEGFYELSERPGWQTLELDTNWRSGADIVAAASRCSAAMSPCGLEQRPGRTSRGSLAHLAFSDLDEAAVCLAGQLADGLAHTDPAGVAVLAPTWRILGRVSEALTEAGVPHELGRGVVAEVDTEGGRWLINVIRAGLSRHDVQSLRRAVNSFRVRVSIGTWSKARSASMLSGESMLHELLAAGALGSVGVSLLKSGDAKSDLWSVAGWLSADLREHGLSTKADEVESAAAALMELMLSGDESAPSTVAQIPDWYAGRHLTETTEPAPSGVTLSTIHGSKGLEWDDVLLLGAQAGDLPRSLKPGPGLEESRRAFYVGLTRARETCTLVTWGSEPAPFVEEVMP